MISTSPYELSDSKVVAVVVVAFVGAVADAAATAAALACLIRLAHVMTPTNFDGDDRYCVQVGANDA